MIICAVSNLLLIISLYEPDKRLLIVSLLVMGIFYSCYASVIWPSVTLVVDNSRLGTAYGVVSFLMFLL